MGGHFFPRDWPDFGRAAAHLAPTGRAAHSSAGPARLFAPVLGGFAGAQFAPRAGRRPSPRGLPGEPFFWPPFLGGPISELLAGLMPARLSFWRRPKNRSALLPLIWPPRHGRRHFHIHIIRIHFAGIH